MKFRGNRVTATMVGSRRGGNIRIMIGTIIGGIAGFYVMHSVETSYKEKMRQRLIEYQNQLEQKEKLEELEDHS